MKFKEYPNSTSLSDTDAFIIDGADGTKHILTPDAAAALVGSISPQAHSRIFRGKNLGSTITDEQKAAIRDGSFKDLFLGDYWEIDGVNWRIVDMDYWYNTGVDYHNGGCWKTHHLVIMPDTIIGTAAIAVNGSVDGGYYNSDMRNTGMLSAKSKITNAFGDLVLNRYEYLVNAVTNGRPSGVLLVGSTVELPTEIMMYGTYIHSFGNHPTAFSAVITTNKTQLALFDVAPRYIVVEGAFYWLRDVCSQTRFANIGRYGESDWSNVNEVLGVRPYFCIG